MVRNIKYTIFIIGLLVTQQAKACDTLTSLSWLLGHWSAKTDTLSFNESWTKVSKQTFEGQGNVYSLKKAKIVNEETLRLVEMSGEFFYFAKVNSNPLPIAFKLKSCTAQSIIFENTEHDFPNFIQYTFISDNSITAHVSGKNGNGFVIEYFRQPEKANMNNK